MSQKVYKKCYTIDGGVYKNAIVYCDVDDTLVRWVGDKHIPIIATVTFIKQALKNGCKVLTE